MAIQEIRYTICPVGNASYIAANKGWLAEGLNKLGVTPVKLQTLPKEHWNVHFNYQDDALFREGGNIPPIWAKSNGAEVVLIGLTFLPAKDYIVVRADSQIDSVEQLRGKKLAVPVHPKAEIDFYQATVQRGFETALAARGVAKGEVEFVELPVDIEYFGKNEHRPTSLGRIDLEALETGKADAAYIGNTRGQAALSTGKYKVIFEISANARVLSPINNVYPSVLTVSKKLAEDAPEVVVEYIRQLQRAAEWAKTNRAEVQELFAEQTYGTVGEMIAARRPSFHKHLAITLSEEGLYALESQKRFLYDHDYIEKDFDIAKWADNSFLKAAEA